MAQYSATGPQLWPPGGICGLHPVPPLPPSSVAGDGQLLWTSLPCPLPRQHWWRFPLPLLPVPLTSKPTPPPPARRATHPSPPPPILVRLSRAYGWCLPASTPPDRALIRVPPSASTGPTPPLATTKRHGAGGAMRAPPTPSPLPATDIAINLRQLKSSEHASCLTRK